MGYISKGPIDLGANVFFVVDFFNVQVENLIAKEPKIQPTWANQRNSSGNQEMLFMSQCEHVKAI